MVPGGINISTTGAGTIGSTFSPTWVTPTNVSLTALTSMAFGNRIFITDIQWTLTGIPTSYFILFDDIDADGVPDANEIIGVFGDSTRYSVTDNYHAYSLPPMIRYGLRAVGYGIATGAFIINAIWVPK